MKSLYSLAAIIIAVASTALAAESPMRAMWVYKTEPIMASASEQGQLFTFCKERRITDLFWQVHFDRSNGTVLKDAVPTRTFLKAAHAQSIRIHTLGGDQYHTLAKNHERFLAMAD